MKHPNLVTPLSKEPRLTQHAIFIGNENCAVMEESLYSVGCNLSTFFSCSGDNFRHSFSHPLFQPPLVQPHYRMAIG